MALSKIRSDSMTDAAIQSNKNLIINGAMQISQRSTSVASITSTGYHTLDRFNLLVESLGTWTMSQDTDVPAGQGFAKSLKIDCTTADSSLAAADRLFLRQTLEGQNLQRMKKGTSNAESVTLSFWVKATKTGTHIINLYDNDNSRYIAQAYTVSSSNTWEHKSLTFAGDTTGAFDNDSAGSLQIVWWLASGSNNTSGTLQTSWGSATAANRAVGQVNTADSTSNNWAITGVQVEVGNLASPFEHEDYGTTLRKCQRYYFRWTADSTYDSAVAGFCMNSTQAYGVYNMPVRMRNSPTMGVGGNWNIFTVGEQAATGFSLNRSQPDTVMTYMTAASGLTAGAGCLMRTNNDDDAYFEFKAEL